MGYSNKEIKEGIINRDEKVFSYFITRFKPYIMKICTTVLANDINICEDLTQEVILKVIKKIELYNEDMKFKSWISKLSYNYFIDHHRKMNAKTKKRKRVKLSKKIIDYFLEINHIKHVSKEEHVLLNSEKETMLECIKYAMERLKRELSTDMLLFELRFLMDMDYNEIYEQTDIKKSKAKIMLHEEKRMIKLYAEGCLKKMGQCMDCPEEQLVE